MVNTVYKKYSHILRIHKILWTFQLRKANSFKWLREGKE